MKPTTFAFVMVALLGCSKDKDKGATEDKGSATPVQAQRPSQMKQTPLPPLQLPDDPQRTAKVELGHHLFFDKRLSGAGDLACYSCHQNEDGNGGHDPIAVGSGGKKQTRHAPVIWNVGYYKAGLYWDGRAPTLEANAKGAWGGGNMGAGPDNLDKMAAQLAALPEYKPLFEAAYPKTEIKQDQVENALSEYERTLICKDTAFDKYANGDKTALSEQQQKGLDVFAGKGMCNVCHTPPFFTQAMGTDQVVFYNVGIGTEVPAEQVDVGRMKVTNQPTDWAAFKPPSLRNVGKSAPYFHDGSAAKLEDAVKVMSTGGIPNKNKTPLQEDRKLTPQETDDLISFLHALDCPGKLDPPADMDKFTSPLPKVEEKGGDKKPADKKPADKKPAGKKKGK